MKKLVSLVASVCMVFAMMPAAAFAQVQAPEEPAKAAEAQAWADADLAAGGPAGEDDKAGEGSPALAQGEAQEGVAAQAAPDPSAGKPAPAAAADGFVLEEPDAEEIVFEAQAGSWQLAADGVHWTYVQDGAVLTGKILIGGSYYYFDPAFGETYGYLMTGWITDEATGLTYYGDPSGTEPGAAGSRYGVLLSGKQTIRDGSGAAHVYYFSTKTCQRKTGWAGIDGSKYYFDPAGGKMKTGWLKLGDYKYYFASNGKMKTGWQTISGGRYYLDPNNGRAATGFATIKGSKYYFASTGKLKTSGWVKVSGSKYYLDKKGKVVTGLKTVSGSKYYFASSGKMQTGPHKISGSLYYFYSSGKAVSSKGWFKGSDKKTRYGLGSGKVATGTKKIGGIYYRFNARTGICEKNLGDEIDRKMQTKSSDTGKLVYVSKSKHQVRIYSGRKGSWNRIYTFSCSVGRSSTPTAAGTYTVKAKTSHHNYKIGGQDVHWNNGLDLTSAGASGNGFNGYVWSGVYSGGSIIDQTLGGNVTGGRIRVSESNSVWMYNNIALKTKVIIQ